MPPINSTKQHSNNYSCHTRTRALSSSGWSATDEDLDPTDVDERSDSETLQRIPRDPSSFAFTIKSGATPTKGRNINGRGSAFNNDQRSSSKESHGRRGSSIRAGANSRSPSHGVFSGSSLAGARLPNGEGRAAVVPTSFAAATRYQQRKCTSPPSHFNEANHYRETPSHQEPLPHHQETVSLREPLLPHQQSLSRQEPLPQTPPAVELPPTPPMHPPPLALQKSSAAVGPTSCAPSVHGPPPVYSSDDESDEDSDGGGRGPRLGLVIETANLPCSSVVAGTGLVRMAGPGLQHEVPALPTTGGFGNSSDSDTDSSCSTSPVAKLGGLNISGSISPLNKSYVVTDEGTLRARGFRIKKAGVWQQDEKADSKQLGSALADDDLLVLGELGRGACAPVVRALWLPELTVLALKSVSVHDKANRNQLLHELTAFSNTAHENVIKCLGGFYNERLGRITISLEFMNRGSLDHAIAAMGPLSPTVLRHVFAQVTRGLEHLHTRHQVHRDIKPANILIDSTGRAKVSDFGLTKQLEDTAAMCQTFVGTMLFLSPERVAGKSFSYPSDVWSLGVCVVFCATGELPFKQDIWEIAAGEHEPRLDPTKFSSEVCDFVASCLVRQPDQRATSAQLLRSSYLENGPDPRGPPPSDWPFRAEQPGHGLDDAELTRLADALIEHAHLDSGNCGNIMARACYQLVAEQLGVGVAVIQDAVSARCKSVGGKASKKKRRAAAALAHAKTGRATELGVNLHLAGAKAMSGLTLPADLPRRGQQLSHLTLKRQLLELQARWAEDDGVQEGKPPD